MSLVECKTYRYLAHTSDDDDRTYRAPEEVEAWRKKDPLQRMKQYLIEQRLLPEAREDELVAEVRAEVDAAAKDAEAAPTATPAMAFTKVWAKPLRPIPGAPVAADAGIEVPARVGQPTEGEPRRIIDTVRATLHDAMAADDRVVLLGEDIGPRGGVFGATAGLHAEFGDNRVIDTPLAESSIVGIAIGLALADLRPVAEIQFADFIHSASAQFLRD